MLSRSILRSSLRALPRTIPRVFPKTPLRPPCRQPLYLNAPRFASNLPRFPRTPPRVVHYRYNPEEVQRAKPLLTSDQVFDAIRSPTTKWIAIIAFGSGTIFYISNLETVPISGRRRFNCYSESTVEVEGERYYKMIMDDSKDSLLPAWDPRTRMVERVMAKLIPASGLEHVNWEVHVINSPECNAFVIPGGKVFVLSGILPIAKNDDGLAAILGHEIAHNLARHAAENMSSLVMLAPIRWTLILLDSTGYTMGLGRVFGDIAMDLGLMRPASRKQESEADYIGLMMMAKSCYDPSEAVKVWKRMEEAQREHEIPQWLSTHPSNSHRISNMEEWLPKAEAARSESECAVTLGYSKDFQAAVGNGGIWSDLFR